MGFDFINTEFGKARFSGGIRGGDEKGHKTFELDIPNYPPLYGEYIPHYDDATGDITITIASCGLLDRAYAYVSPSEYWNKYPAMRRKIMTFTSKQRQVLEQMIKTLCNSSDARDGLAAFSSKGTQFLGTVNFLPGWLVEK